MRILGIDPGTRVVGYGLLEKKGSNVIPLDYGAIKISAALLIPERLKKIFTELNSLYKKFKPDEVVVEDIFYARDVRATIKIGEARGVVLLSAAMKNIAIYEYTPSEIKKSVTGNGLAHKSQVQRMVLNILSLKELPALYDISDALAIALCHVYRG